MTSPIKKRLRRENPPDHNDGEKVDTKLVDETVEQLRSNVDSFRPEQSLLPLQRSFLALKALQRNLMDSLNQSTQTLEQKKDTRKEQERHLEALAFERIHLEKAIQQCQNFQCPNLEQLARSEIDNHQQLSTPEILQTYLQADVNDPAQKQLIVAQLHQELSLRGTLERDVKNQQQLVTEAKKVLSKQQTFLHSLPEHLEKIERASMPLQKHMQGHNVAISSERSARLEMAKQLSPPLYTLFYQLQSYFDQLDQAPTLNVKQGEVALKLPVPLADKLKFVTIHFRHHEHKIWARASGCNISLHQDVLLDELFPHDCPDPGTEHGRAYHWCNYMAGLHPISPEAQNTSTRVILRELQRRVRSNATFKHILQLLYKKQIPSVPELGDSTDSCTLESFTAGEQQDNVTNFVVELRKGRERLLANVKVNIVRYPAVPPYWSLNSGEFYETKYDMLERELNTQVIDRIIKEKEGYDWVIVHQLHSLMKEWGSWQENPIDNGVRSRRGRDRLPVHQS